MMTNRQILVAVITTVMLASVLVGALAGGVLWGERAPGATSRPKLQELAERQPETVGEDGVDSVRLLGRAGEVALGISGALRIAEIEYMLADRSFEVEVIFDDGREAKVLLDEHFEVMAQDGDWSGGERWLTDIVLEQAAAAALAHTGGGRVVGIEAGDEWGAYEVDIVVGGEAIEVYLDDDYVVLGQR